MIISKYNLSKEQTGFLKSVNLNNEKSENGLVNLINELNKEQIIPESQFFNNLLQEINRKDCIVVVAYFSKVFYVANILFENCSYNVEISEYNLADNLVDDKDFLENILNILTVYQNVSEETLFNISNKLREVFEREKLENIIISAIKDYSKSKAIKTIYNKEIASKIYSYLNENIDIFIDKMIIDKPHTTILYKFVSTLLDVGTIISLVLNFCLSCVCIAIGGLPCILGLLTSFCGEVYLINKLVKYSAKYRDTNNYKILNHFLQDLQNDFDITASNELKNSESVCVLDDTKQQILLEEKVKLRIGENIFRVSNDSEKIEYVPNVDNSESPTEIVYDGGFKLKFGYKEE